MLLKTVLVKNGIEKLSEEISHFIHQAQHVRRWSPKLFTDEFYTAVVLKSNALERELRAFFREFRRLPENHRTLVVEEFNHHNAVRDLCAGHLRRTQHWQEIDNPMFAAATKSLFVWMYENTLRSVAYREFSGEYLRITTSRTATHMAMPSVRFAG